HSQAAIASYPWLSCTGEQVEVVNDWGVFKEIYCAGNDSTFEFLENVLMEVMELFPSKYIHIGGDEAPKYRWEHCDKCQNRIQTENLKDEHELQSYFIQRIEKFLQKNGRELIGWDEILEGGLSATATVQSWRGFEGGIKAAENGNGVVMSPTSHCYFDYGLQSIDLKKVYEFNPIPSELEEQFHKNILGGECNLWSEHIPDEANLDSKVFPRILAMSEVLWAAPEKRNYAEFYNRVQEHYPLLEKLKVKYGLETTPAKIQTFIKEGKIYATMVSEIPNATYEIRWDGKEMELDGDFTQFEKLEKDTFEVKDWKLSVKVLKNGKPYGEKVEQFFEFHKAIGAKVTYHSNFSRWYPAAGEQALVDGRTGIIDFKDGNWQGFWGEPIDVELDLREVKEFNSVFMRFNQYQNSWIFRPKAMKIEISEDGENWNNFLEKEFGEEKPYNKKMIWNDVGTNFLIQKAQYIRIHVENYGKVPDWHEAAGQDCWLFLDEIIVK
ncbi:MAG: family 20 glycosylhydrolase, partial [Crocinitomicaceae bacterium]|nr:family 20 glycosylhydrolase [Crocinitomicaceae bacterium]